MDITLTNGGHPTDSPFDSRPGLLSLTSSGNHGLSGRGAGKGSLAVGSSSNPTVELSTYKIDKGPKLSNETQIPNHALFSTILYLR